MDENYQKIAESYRKAHQAIRECRIFLILLIPAFLVSLFGGLTFDPRWLIFAVVFPFFIIAIAAFYKTEKAKLPKTRREYFAAARQMAAEIRSRREERLSSLSPEERKEFILACAIRRYQDRIREAKRMKKIQEKNIFSLIFPLVLFGAIAYVLPVLQGAVLVPIFEGGQKTVKIFKCRASMRRFKEKMVDTWRRQQEISYLHKKMAVAAK